MDLFAIIVVLIAYIIKGLSGFANALVFSSFMSFQNNNINISPIEVLMAFPSNLILTVKERKNLSWKIFLPLIIMVIIGVIPGTILLKNIDATVLKICFGFAIALISIEIFLREFGKNTKKVQSSPLALTIIGIISGVLSGLFGVGAFLVAYISRTTNNSSAFKANLCIVFMVENIFRIIIYISTGILTLTIAKQALLLMPFMLIGLFIGILLSKKISESLIKKIIIILLLLTGLSLMITNILTLLL